MKLARLMMVLLMCASPALRVSADDAHDMHDNDIHSLLLFDRTEYQHTNTGNALAWEAQGWIGTDVDRLWLRSEGEHADGRIEAADAELLFGHSVSAWWDAVGGLRQDFKPGDDRTWIALGIQGLAPQRFEVAATAYASNEQRTAARLEVEYKLLLTNRLILRPRFDLWLYGKEDEARGLSSGLATGAIGLRMHYEFTRRFAPYIGIEYERAFEDTASLRRAASVPVADTRWVVGLRTWF